MSSDVVRTCIGCRQRAAAHELLRVVASERGHGPVVLPDPTRRASGRGAHLHPTTECLALARRRRAFPRALRVAGPLDSGPVEDYLQHLSHTPFPGDHERSAPRVSESTRRNWSSSS